MTGSISSENRGMHTPSISFDLIFSVFIVIGLAVVLGLLVSLLNAPVASRSEKSSPALLSDGSMAPTEVENIPRTLPSGTLAKVDEVLTPRLRAVLDHIARRYRVSPDALRPIFQTVQLSGRERNLDPLLIVAIIGIESSFNPFSESSMGALGLMQVVPRFHQDKLPAGAEKSHFLDPVTNIRVGTHVLQESISRNGGLIAGLQQFGGAINDEERTYSNKVLAEKERLEQAVLRGSTNANI